MATFTTTNLPTSLPHRVAAIVPRTSISGLYSSSPLLLHGFKTMATRGRVRCSVEDQVKRDVVGGGVISLMAVEAALATTAGPAMALVDERMSTEGTGLPFGLSNNILGWILLGVFGLIWSLYFVYSTDLDEDEDSGLSL